MKKFLSFMPFEVQLTKAYSPEAMVEILNVNKKITLPIFKKASDNYFFRFSGAPGKYTFSAANEKGSFVISSYIGKNDLFKRGPIRISSNKKYFTYEDGSPFFYLADTWWYGATQRMSYELFKRMAEKRKEQGFTAIQIVAGIPPETDPWSEDVRNNGGYPFNKDFSVNLSYFDALDTRIQCLVDLGIVPVIFGGWGHHIDILGVERMKEFWREIIARYSAYPVIFSLCGEVDVFLTPPHFSSPTLSATRSKTIIMFSKLSPEIFTLLRRLKHKVAATFTQQGSNRLLQKRISSWSKVGEYLKQINTFNRPVTGHISMIKSIKDLFNYPDYLTFDAFQSGHDKDRAFYMVDTIKKSKELIINMEPWYEGILGNFGPYEQRLAFWLCILSGAKGHTYGAHGIWQMASGNDNFMGHWGSSDAEKAFAFQGAKQIASAKKFLMQFPWGKLSSVDNVITPFFSQKNIFYPLSAWISDDTYFFYFPDAAIVPVYSLHIAEGEYTALYIDPVTMKVVSRSSVGGKESIRKPDTMTTRDMVLVITKE